MLDDLELAGDGDTRIAGVPVWAVVMGILALIGTAMLVIQRGCEYGGQRQHCP